MEISSSQSDLISCSTNSCSFPYTWRQTEELLNIQFLVNRNMSPKMIKTILTPSHLSITTTDGISIIDQDFQNKVEIHGFFWIITEREEKRYLEVEVKKKTQIEINWNNLFLDINEPNSNYTWSQNSETVSITFPVNYNLISSEIKVEISYFHLKITTCYGDVIVDKELENINNVDHFSWTLNEQQSQKFIAVSLEKKLGPWQRPFIGDTSQNNIEINQILLKEPIIKSPVMNDIPKQPPSWKKKKKLTKKMFDSDDYYIEKEPELKGEVKKKKSIKDTLIGFVKNNKELIHAYKKE